MFTSNTTLSLLEAIATYEKQAENLTKLRDLNQLIEFINVG